MARRYVLLAVGLISTAALVAGCGGSTPRAWIASAAHSQPTRGGRRAHYAITLHWSGVSIANQTAYRVTLDGHRQASLTTDRYLFTNLACGTTYTLGVQAQDGAGHVGAVATARYTAPACAAFTCPARCFYISYTNGSNYNAGTSEASPWKLAPGMVGFTGSYTPEAGDVFIFEGGDTWPNSVFPLTASGSGSADHYDYYGADPYWYRGPDFTKPTFDAGRSNISGSYDGFLDLNDRDYIEIDDLALTNWTATGIRTYGGCDAIGIGSSSGTEDQHIIINRVTVSGVSVDLTSSEDGDCAVIQGYTAAPFAGSSVVENSTFTQTAGTDHSYGVAIDCVGTIENNVVNGFLGQLYPCGHGTVSGNRLENCAYSDGATSFPPNASGFHADAIQTNGADGTFYIHDNVVDGTGGNGQGECESMLIGNSGETDYVWNNVLANLDGNGIGLTQESSPGVDAYIWNNTLEGGFGRACLRAGHTGTWNHIAFQNNLCITVGTGGEEGVITGGADGVSASTLNIDHNVVLTPARAASNGYAPPSGTHPYQPQSSSALPTTHAGTNLTGHCAGSVSGLCLTTSSAGELATSSRPSSGAWNAGAY